MLEQVADQAGGRLAHDRPVDTGRAGAQGTSEAGRAETKGVVETVPQPDGVTVFE